ncbi:MAG: carboxypeptidase-like regulatory domain-containing protein, partial [Tannerella sp.]|nr:carboxypeptidase-like regulatory domain-containing protein [Tannerella sp.]
MKTVFRVLLCLAPSMTGVCHVFGQYTIGGKLATETGEPVAAVVSLYASDTLVSATMSDAKGVFEFGEHKKGNYLLTVSAVDYQPVSDSVALYSGLNRRYVLYPVREIGLEEVTVTADRSHIVRQTANGAVFQLSASARKAANAFSALNEIPTLVVDETNRTVRMNSGSAPLILINGIQRGNGL